MYLGINNVFTINSSGLLSSPPVQVTFDTCTNASGEALHQIAFMPGQQALNVGVKWSGVCV